jgi:hypothetical protein
MFSEWSSSASVVSICVQVNIGNKYNQQMGLDHLCKLHRGDFQNQPWENETFDCAFAVEATCHSPDKVLNKTHTVSPFLFSMITLGYGCRSLRSQKLLQNIALARRSPPSLSPSLPARTKANSPLPAIA